MNTETEYVLADGPLVKPRHHPDKNAQDAWDQVLKVLTMLCDMTSDGARVRVTRSPIFPNADHKLLAQEAVTHMVEHILANAEVVDA